MYTLVYTFLLGGYIYINFMTFRYIYRKRAEISRFFCHKGCDIFRKTVTNTPQARRNQPFFLWHCQSCGTSGHIQQIDNSVSIGAQKKGEAEASPIWIDGSRSVVNQVRAGRQTVPCIMGGGWRVCRYPASPIRAVLSALTAVSGIKG